MQLLVHVALILVQLLMASLAVVGKLVFRQVQPGFLILVRVVGAAAILLMVAALHGALAVRRRDVLPLAVLGLLGVSLNQSLFLSGLRYTTAINATILVTTIPVFTVLGALATRREPPSYLKTLGIAVAGAGAVYLIGPERISLAPRLALGNGMIVLGMIAYSMYLLFSKPMLDRYPPLTVSFYLMAFGALGVAPFGLHAAGTTDFSRIEPRTWLLIGYIVCCPTILAYFLNIWALKRVSSNVVAVYIYLQPVITAVTAPLLLEGERITSRAIGAGLSIFLGVGLVIWAERLQHRQLPMDVMVGE